jgi:hypothetical protein
VSFDVYFQRFRGGDAEDGGGAEARMVLAPFLRPIGEGAEQLAFGDGTAEVYGLDDDGMMVAHIEGESAWGILVDAARAAEWAIMPVGTPACILDESKIADLPEELRGDVCVIATGDDLQALINRA